jgi:hypothetical protein
VNHREEMERLAFDEQRALEELQNLKRQIQRARDQRERAEAEFNSFLRSFHEEPAKPDDERRKTPRPAPLAPEPQQPSRVEQPPPARYEQPPPATRIEPPQPPRVEPQQPVQAPAPIHPVSRHAVESAPTTQQSFAGAGLESRAFEPAAAPPLFDPQPVTAFQPASFDSDQEALPPPVVSGAPPLLVRPKPKNVGAWVAIPIALIVLVAVVLMFRGDEADPASQPQAQAPVATVPEGPSPDPAAQTQPASPAPAETPPQAGVNLEMVTTRAVWVRVTIDGRRAIERELPAGERIPLRGERSILIRAGDAGAVSISRDGRELGPLGEDAMVATREFKDTASPATRQ